MRGISNTQDTLEVATVILIGPFSRGFTYKTCDLGVQSGDLVLVSFRKKQEYGVCWSIQTTNAQELEQQQKIKPTKLLPIQEVIHGNLIDLHTRSFLEKVAHYNIIKIGNLLRLVLPDALLKPKKTSTIRKFQVTEQAENIVNNMPVRSRAAMMKLLSEYKAGEIIIESTFKANKIASRYIAKALQLDIIRLTDIPDAPTQTEQLANNSLSNEQKSATDHILKHLESFAVILLHGITGSGKTAVYCEAIKSILVQKKAQILIMMPEIALTASLLEHLQSKFGIHATLWHSSISDSKKKDNIRDIMQGESSIVVGARSALYLPYKNLRCIVVDEEHDASYKQNESPIYNARDMAIMRGQIGNFPVILSSATPSLESYRNAMINKYIYVTMGTRFGNATLPRIQIVDLNIEKLPKKKFLSPIVRCKITEAISNEEQVMIFLNRRGYARIMMCKNCGYIFLCPNCDNHLSYHKSNNNLKCHYCNFSLKKPDRCRQCNDLDSLEDRGLGIEKIAEEVEEIIQSKEHILIMSSDTINKHNTINDHLEKINNRSAKVIVGTQIISKGHNFPHLKLVIVVDMDIGMMLGDFRAMERIYQLLVQVTGRAGRSSQSSKVLIQTYNPRHKALQAIINARHEEFYEHELQIRQGANLPPFIKQIAIIIASEDNVAAKHEAQTVSHNIGAFLAANPPYRNGTRVLGPVESIIHYLKRKYRYRILLCSNNMKSLRTIVNHCVMEHKMPTRIQVKIDVDPHSFI